MNTGTPTRTAPAETLTPAQHEALICIRDHIRDHSISPTLKEIALQLDVVKTAASKTVSRLCRKGFLAKAPGRFRNIVVTQRGWTVPNRAA